MNCVFCMILYGMEPAERVMDGIATLGIRPLNPVTEGHVLIIPRKHVRDAAEDPRVTGEVMSAAAYYIQAGQRSGEFASANIITSIGVEATQTVFHLHAHVIPRREGDGLALPWAT